MPFCMKITIFFESLVFSTSESGNPTETHNFFWPKTKFIQIIIFLKKFKVVLIGSQFANRYPTSE